MVQLNGISVQTLIDTGSQVSTVSKSFYDHYLSNVELHSLKEILQVEGANGSRVPYHGYVELQLLVPGCLIDCDYIPALFLVVPDTSYNSKTPVLLGTQMLFILVLSYRTLVNLRLHLGCGREPSMSAGFKCKPVF